MLFRSQLAEIEPRTFSFNSPYGACPECTGLGTKLEIDEELRLADPTIDLSGEVRAAGEHFRFAPGVGEQRGGFLDRIINTSSNAFFSIPGYWLAILLVLVFAVYNPLLPATGYVDFASDPAAWAQSLVLPILAISIPSAAGLARNTRAAMYDALSQEHLRTLRAIGTPGWRLIYVHALRFASVQIIAMIGLNFVLTFGGTVMIEQLFSMPGLGVNAQAAIGTHNIPAIQATVVITTLVVVVTNLVTELLIMFLNPKIRTR